MKQIPLDYKPAEQTYTNFDDGNYEVIGITYFSLNDDGKPILKATSKGSLTARIRFTLKDGKEGPTYFPEIGELPTMVKAFGGDITKLPKMPEVSQSGKVSAYLSAVESLAKGKTVIEVKKGFVKSIKGSEVPVGLYYMKLIDITPKRDDIPFLLEGTYGPYFFATYRIVAGEGGSESIYNGVVFKENMGYGLKVDEDGNPDWMMTEKGGFTKNAVNMHRLSLYTAPDLFEGSIRFEDPSCILPEFLESCLKADKVFKVMRIPNKNGKICNNFDSIESVSTGVKQTSFLTPKVNPKDTDEMNEKAKTIFASLFTALSGDNPFTEGYTLSPLGKQNAKLYLSPLKDSGLLSHGTISKLTYSEVEIIFKHIVIPDEYRDVFNRLNSELLAIGIGLEIDSEEDFN